MKLLAPHQQCIDRGARAVCEGRKLDRRGISQAAVRPRFVVLVAPLADFSTRIEQVAKPTHVQTFIAELAMEAFDMTVLRGSSWLNMFQPDAVIYAPG